MIRSREQIAAAVEALDAQRAALGNAVVDLALAPLRSELAALSAQQAQQQQLKQVSVLFVDVVGSTAIGQKLGPEEIHAVMDGALERFTAAVQSHRGRVLQYTGDGMLAAFGTDEVHEDDVESAVRAGLAIIDQAALLAPDMRRQHGVPDFNVRAGVHTGRVLLGGGVDAEGSIRGATVNLAARMEQSAPPGCLRVSHESYQHVRGLFDVVEQPPINVKGVDQPLRSYLVERSKPRAFRVPTRGIDGVHSPMVGRQAQLEAVCGAFVDVVAENRGRALTIVAEAGIGKSRLLAEFQQVVNPRTCWMLLARAHPRSGLHPYGMLRDMLARQFNIADSDPGDAARAKLVDGLSPITKPEDEGDVHLLGHLIGLDFSTSAHVADFLRDEQAFKERAFAAALRCLRRLCGVLPVVMVFDDMHWADAGTLDFVRHLLDHFGDMPVLCLLTTRPSLLEPQADGSQAIAGSVRLELKPLDRVLSDELAATLLQRLPEVPDALRALLTGGAEGNPFYMEELVRMLIDDGVIDAGGDRWQVVPEKLAGARVPSTLTGVIQARLDSLSAPERLALQQAAIVGHVFDDSALAAIDSAAPAMLARLHGRRLIMRHDASSFEDSGAYVFQHNLLHQVTYDTVLKGPRLEAHSKVGAFWRQRAGVASAQQVSPATCRALAEAQFHSCKSDARAYVDWFEGQFVAYAAAYAGQSLRPLTEQLVEVCAKEFGQHDAHTAKALVNQARASLILGRPEQAEALLRQAMSIQDALLPLDHPDIALTLAVLSGCLSGRGDFVSAEPLLRRVLEIRAKLLGPEHPLTLAVMDNLAKVTLELGRLDKAEKLFRSVLTARERDLGLDSPVTAFALTALGEVLNKLRRHAEAEDMIRRALAVQLKTLPEDNPEIGLSQWHLAEALRGQGSLVEAERHARSALQLWETKFGAAHEWTAWGLIGLAEIQLALGEGAQAADLALRAAEVLEGVYGPAHAVLGTTLGLRARAQLHQGLLDEARAGFRRALEILNGAGADTGDEARKVREALASIPTTN